MTGDIIESGVLYLKQTRFIGGKMSQTAAVGPKNAHIYSGLDLTGLGL